MKKGCLAVVVSGFTLFLVTLFCLVYVLVRYERPGLADETFVEIPIGGAVPDYHRVQGFMTDTPMSMRELLGVLKLAEDDPDVRGVVLRISPLAAGWAKAHEIREAVSSLADSGKQVIATGIARGTGDSPLPGTAKT